MAWPSSGMHMNDVPAEPYGFGVETEDTTPFDQGDLDAAEAAGYSEGHDAGYDEGFAAGGAGGGGGPAVPTVGQLWPR